jgi:hypothetical protein
MHNMQLNHDPDKIATKKTYHQGTCHQGTCHQGKNNKPAIKAPATPRQKY